MGFKGLLIKLKILFLIAVNRIRSFLQVESIWTKGPLEGRTDTPVSLGFDDFRDLICCSMKRLQAFEVLEAEKYDTSFNVRARFAFPAFFCKICIFDVFLHIS